MKVRYSQRRSNILEARRKSVAHLSELLESVFSDRVRSLKRELRDGGNLRKRISRMDVPDELPPELLTLKKAALVVGGNPPSNPPPENLPHDLDSWQKFRIALLIALNSGLAYALGLLADVENDWWTSRGYEQVDLEARATILAYQARVGRNLTLIADDTMLDVHKMVSDWYVSGRDFSSLLADLNKYFGSQRAQLIATQEVNNLNSQISLAFMTAHRTNQWAWDAMGEKPCESELEINGKYYMGCMELNGKIFRVGDPMPPFASHIGCQCLATPIKEAT